MKPASYYFRDKIADDPKSGGFERAAALEELNTYCMLFNASIRKIREHDPELNLRLVIFEHGGIGYKTDKPEEKGNNNAS